MGKIFIKYKCRENVGNVSGMQLRQLRHNCAIIAPQICKYLKISK